MEEENKPLPAPAKAQLKWYLRLPVIFICALLPPLGIILAVIRCKKVGKFDLNAILAAMWIWAVCAWSCYFGSLPTQAKTANTTATPADHTVEAYLYWQDRYASEKGVPLNNFSSEKKKLNKWLQAQTDSSSATLYLDVDSSGRYKLTMNTTAYTYVGEQSGNRPDGKGMISQSIAGTDRTAIVYIGNFKKGYYSGYGLLFSDDFESDTTQLSMHWDSDSEEYAAFFRTWMNDVYYEGKFRKGKMSGIGNYYVHTSIETQEDAAEYERAKAAGEVPLPYAYIACGTFKNDEYNGKIKLYLDGMLQYNGNMKNGKMSGKGTSYFRDSTQIQYNGQFKSDQYNGKGTLYDESGNVIYSGKWDMGDYA